MTYKSDNIIIVGGGSAGWMTAAHLIKSFPDKNITVVESDIIPTIGVGESTLADFRLWLDFLEVDVKDFMRSCNASYKLGISFYNFLKENSKPIHYMFGAPDLEHTKFGLKDWSIIKLNEKQLEFGDYTNYYWKHSYCFDQNKLPHEKSDFLQPFDFDKDVAFQVNAIEFANWLREKYCIPRGVNQIVSTVKTIKPDSCGNIQSILLDNDLELKADLYVDCTGFKSMLLGEFMSSEFISTTDSLPNNKAWFGPYQYSDKNKELELSTRCTALKNGWVWNTPLWSRVGTGYVYCDKYTTDEEALEEFKQHLDSKNMPHYNPNRSKDMVFKNIKIKNGYYKSPWIKNVVAIGLAQGFLEPLESTGLFILYYSASCLADSLSRDRFTVWDSDRFNRKVNEMYENMLKFVEAHFLLSTRDDSEYWKYFSERMSPETQSYVAKGHASLASQVYVGFGHIENGFNELYHLKSNKFEKNYLDLTNYQNTRRYKIKKAKEFIETLPTHYEYLRDEIYNESE